MSAFDPKRTFAGIPKMFAFASVCYAEAALVESFKVSG